MARTTTSGLTKQYLEISLTGGIDRKTDPMQLPNGATLTADNVQYITEKQMRKRFGYKTYNTPGNLQGAPFTAIGVRDDIEPILVGSGTLNRINTETNLSTYIPAGMTGHLSAKTVTSSSGIGTDYAAPTNASSATDGEKYSLVTWYEPQGATATCFYGIEDLKTGAWIISPQVLNPAVTLPGPVGQLTAAGALTNVPFTSNGITAPRAFYNGQYFFIAYMVNASCFYTQVDNTTGTKVDVPYVNNTVTVQMVSIDLLNLQAGVSPVSFNKQLLSFAQQLTYTASSGSDNITATATITGPQTTFGTPAIGWDANLVNGQFTISYVDMSEMMLVAPLAYKAVIPSYQYSSFKILTLPIVITTYSVTGTVLTQIASNGFRGAFPWSIYHYPNKPLPQSQNAIVQTNWFTRLALDASGPSGNPYCVVTNGNMFILDASLQVKKTYLWSPSNNYAPAIAHLVGALWANGKAYSYIPWIKPNGDVAIHVTVYDSTATSFTVLADLSPPASTINTGILSRPFYYNGSVFAWIFASGYSGARTYRSQVLAEITGSGKINYIARTGYQQAGYIGLGDQVIPADVLNPSGTKQFITHLTRTTLVDKKYTRTYGNLARTEFDFGNTASTQVYKIPNGGCFISDPMPRVYDGTSLTEAGFTTAPEFTFSTGGEQMTDSTIPVSYSSTNAYYNSPSVPNAIVSAKGKMAYGTYFYVACFVRRDAYGNVIYSGMSVPFQITLADITQAGATPAIVPNAVQFPPLNYFNDTNVYVEYYRTTANTPKVYYFLDKVPLGTAYVDTHADADLSGAINPYTFSGELDNDPPPAVQSIAFGETRAYLIPADARNQVWASKLYSPGRSLEWSTGLLVTEGGTNSGEFTAVAVLDTNVIVFKSDGIIYFNGNGPDNAGLNNNWSSFQKLQSDVGCIDPASLATIPQGLLFRSRRGIELLTRGLQVQYVGAPIEPLIRAMGTINNAVVLPQYTQVRFSTDVADDPVLVYDYTRNRWSTYSGMASVCAANVLNNYWWIAQDGSTLNIETPNEFTDNGAFIPMTIETSEIPTMGIQGWGRAYRLAVLGRYGSPHLLTLSFAYDHDTNYVDSVLYGAYRAVDVAPAVAPIYSNNGQMLDALTNTGPAQFRLSRMPRQVMQSLRIKLQDSPLIGYYIDGGAQLGLSAAPGEGLAISGITLEYGQKAGVAKLSPQKTV